MPYDTDPPDGRVHNTAPGYIACSHRSCHKKANPTVRDHDCCGRCRDAHNLNCLQEAMANYDGPGSFYHRYWEAMLKPGVCATCGELPEAHPSS